MTELEHLRVLCATLAGELANAWCCGSRSCLDRHTRQIDAQPGDLVVEQSTHYRTRGAPWCPPEHTYGDRLGRLLAVRLEPLDREDSDGMQERVWYVVLSDGRIHRWVNASFAAIPDEPGGHRE